MIAKPGGVPPGALPQVAFSGRSNVGKSSLINLVLRRTRKKVARVSATPGKTQLINFFLVNELFFLVDLPGFGYAKVPKSTRDSWRTLIETYLEGPHGPKGVVHLVDSRHPPTEMDCTMMTFLGELQMPALVVLTKIDRIPVSKREQVIAKAGAALDIDGDQVLGCSSKSGEGREELLESITALLELPVHDQA